MGTEPLTAHVNDSDSNEQTDSENSGSCSYSSSSDSECGADGKSGVTHNRRRNRNLAPQFSVTHSCHTGLKLKIAAVPRDPTNLPNKSQLKSINKSEQKAKVSPKKIVNKDTKKRSVKKKNKSILSESSTSSDDSCSDCSGSRCSSDNEDLGTIARRAARQRTRLANKQAASSNKNTTTGTKNDTTPIKNVTTPTKNVTTPTKNVTTPTKNVTTPTKNVTTPTKSVTTPVKNVVPNKNAATPNKEVTTLSEQTTVTTTMPDTKPKTVPNVKVKDVNVSAKTKTKCDDSPAKLSPSKTTPVKRGRGRPRTKLTSTGATVGADAACGGATAAFSSPSSTSSSSSSSSSSPSSSSSDSDSPDTTAGGSANGSSASDDSSAALAAACSLQVIDEEDLAALLPEQPPPPPPTFAPFAPPPPVSADDDKSMDNGDGSSSEMELTPQLVSAAIQRATADSSGSDNECSNSGVNHPTTTHYASSLLQQFVARTQMLSSTAMTPIAAPMENVPLDQCVLGQISSLPEMNQITPNFLTAEHLSGQHLSPQQTEELTQINKDLEEISSITDSVPIHAPSLEDCVDNNDFMQLDISQTNSDLCSSDLMKSSPISVPALEIASTSAFNDSPKNDLAASSVDSQDETKSMTTERRRPGRPRKIPKVKKESIRLADSLVVKNDILEPLNNVNNDFCPNEPPNVSPDSGILSNHNSPAHSPLRRTIDENARIESLAKENEVHERRGRSRSQARRKNIKVETSSPTPKPQLVKPDKVKRTDHKIDIASLDRMLYATDRVLYPPRRKAGRPPQNKNPTKRGPGRPHKIASSVDSGDSDCETRANRSVLSEVYAKRRDLNKLASLPKKINRLADTSWRDHQSDNEVGPDDPLDPTWRQIDLNPKYKDILSGYKSDHDVKPYKSCSRLIESGYKSDYGCRSGYKSDHRSGYKSDHRSGYKSDKGGYKTDHSVRSMRRRIRKLKKSRSVRDQSYYKNQKYFVSDQEILMLANKTFGCLSLGHASDSETESAPSNERDFVSASAKYKVLSTRKQNNFINNSDPFAPAPVFSGFNARVSPSLGKFNLFQTLNSNSFSKTPFKPAHFNNLLSGSKSAFTHKFACPPVCTTIDKALSPGRKRDGLVNNNNLKFTKNNSPKNKKGLRNAENIFPTFSRERSPEVATHVFEKARNIYIPNEELARNIFLKLKKPQKKVAISVKKQRKPFIIAPSKITLKPTCRLSRISPKLESRHHRHKTKRRHRRSRSVSRSRELIKPDDTVDQKFCQEVETLSNHFVKLCHIAPKCISQQSVKVVDKALPENAKCLKRVSKKRKVSDNTELATPSSKRRHKKQLADAQSKEPGANEHKLPLKKRHYHVNSCTSNSLSLSLVATGAQDQPQEHSFLCTETHCMGAGDTPIKTKSNEKVNQDTEQMLKTIKSGISTTVESLTVQIDEAIEACISHYNSPNSVHSTDDETVIKKPTGEHSELSKKIYETSEKLKAVHKMVHDLEKSLPKNEDCELVTKDLKTDSAKIETQKTIPTKFDNKNASCPGTLSTKNVPIVTPKKRHRMETDKIVSISSLDQVVQSLSKKLLDDKVIAVNSTSISSPARNVQDAVRTPEDKQLPDAPEPTKPPEPKPISARTLSKASNPPSHKSEIMTRKKNRLEGLTSNLVSKMNPSTATKMLDTLMNNNRQSIETRIEREKTDTLTDNAVKVQDEKVKSGKESGPINTRATVIKSPSTKTKLPEAKKQKNANIINEQMVMVNVDKPTGIFEPSIDIEMQIPKSSICTTTSHHDKVEPVGKNKQKLRSGESKNNQKLPRISLDVDTEIPLSLIAKQIDGVLTRPKRSESIASVISDKIQETTGGHNLRHSKRVLTSDSEVNLIEDSNEKKKKKLTSSILRECKFVLPPQIMHAKVQVEKITLPADLKKAEVEKLPVNTDETKAVDPSVDNMSPLKKKIKRRKVNRTGFPNMKKKKKKLTTQPVPTSEPKPCFVPQAATHSAFDRVPKHGETTHTFLERTAVKKNSEMKVLLNKDHCSRQGRLSVISLDRLQGKNALDNNNIPVVKLTDIIKPGTPIHAANNSVSNINLNLFKGLKTFSDSSAINKWEVLSETDSIPPMTPSSFGNDPEDSIPLSLLNLKPERPHSRMDRGDRLKRKTLERSPSRELEDIISLSKETVAQNNFNKRLRSKSSLGLYCPGDRRSTRTNDRLTLEAEDAGIKNLKSGANLPLTKKLLSDKFENKILRPALLNQHRKSRMSQRKVRDCTPSSRESSLDTMKSIKLSPASRDTSVDTIRRDHCFENDPLPLQEKELDFEKSIDLLSKNVISKKRMASSRDDSPASSVERARGTAPGKRNPRLRKKYLVAGLFSQYYKDDDPKPADPKAKVSLNPSECPRGLLSPPPYCERWVRQRKQHFTLPYDVWWQHQYSQPVPSWNYRKIRTNVYYDVKPSSYGCESQACNCSPTSGCQDDCINRMVYAECEAQHCPCKESCKNQRIQRHEWAPALDKFMTESKGWGVRSKEAIPAGEFILEYVGEVVSDREFKERMASRYARDTHHYCLHLDGGLVIDGHRMGGDGRFVNHSCQPNCEMQKWSANGTFRMALFALRDIEPGEELTYDYNFSLFNPADGQICKCESENCRGVIGGKSQRVSRTSHKPICTSRASSVASLHSTNSSTISTTPQNQVVTPARVGRPRKAVKCNKKSESQRNICDLKSITLKYQQLHRLWQEPQMKPLSAKDKTIARQRHCFLFRNLEKVRRMKDRLPLPPALTCPAVLSATPVSLPTAPLTALQTRLRGARNKNKPPPPPAQKDPKQASLYTVFRDIYNMLVQEKDDKQELICTPLLHCKPDKTKVSDTTTSLECALPSDLSTIEAGIESGKYKSVATFDNDINTLLSTAIREYGRHSLHGLSALQLRKVYNGAKLAFAEQLTAILAPDESLPAGFLQKRKQEEVIMCICGLHFEEGLMVQCGGEVSEGGGAAGGGSVSTLRGCGVWQHAHCMRVTDTTQPYLCHRCQPRVVDLEIPMDEYTEEGHQFYLSLLRGSLQVRQGDTVYVLRDIPIDQTRPDRSQPASTTTSSTINPPATEPAKRTERKKMKSLKDTKGPGAKKVEERKSSSEVGKVKGKEKDKDKEKEKEKNKESVEVQKHTYKSIGDISVSELDIFRVERLWKHKDSGESFVYGHHYLRPHETYHEPTRKFFPNEVMRVPLYEAVPIDLVMSQCWVMDVNTYCKGRPVGAVEEHVYICELRVDRCARLFTKVSRPKYPVCTKSYAFNAFPQRLKISRTYAPHEVLPEFLKGRAKNQSQDKEKDTKTVSKVSLGTVSTNTNTHKETKQTDKQKTVPNQYNQQNRLQKPAHAQKQQREKLNGILLRLLDKLAQGAADKALDVSYLLEGRRQRKKISS